MEKKLVVDRSYLESLSFADLVSLANEYGIDVPEDLDRPFLIAELLDVITEFNSDKNESMDVTASIDYESILPTNYNETQIAAIMQSPAWAFVFWNVSETDSQKLRKQGLSLSLRVCVYDNPVDIKPVNAFEIQTLSKDQEQYVLLPAGAKYVRIELVYVDSSSGNVLATSNLIEIPKGCDDLNELVPGKSTKSTEIFELSGFSELLLQQYKNHRQAF